MNIGKISKPIMIVAATTAVATGLGSYVMKAESRQQILEVYVFELSGGRSIFVRTPEDKRILIDGGSNSDVIREITAILPFYSRRIDWIIATNTEGKNISGLINIIERYDVGKACIPGITTESIGLASSTDEIYETFVNTLHRQNIPVQDLMAGSSIHFDSKVNLKVLFPIQTEMFQYSKASPPELLFRLNFGKNVITFAGNASNKVQKFLATSTFSDASIFAPHNPEEDRDNTDALIVSHSALPTNIYSGLVEKLQPRYLVYSRTLKSASTNPKTEKVSSASKSPKKKTKVLADPFTYIRESDKFNIREQGSVKITTDGSRLTVSTVKEK